MVLGVATLNVCGLPWSRSSLPSLAKRAVEFGRRLEESGLDVVNLQEVGHGGTRSRRPTR
jgi:hypothetical protein